MCEGLRVAVITLFPEMFESLTSKGVCARAVTQGVAALRYFNPRDYADDKHRTVDDRPYGGGPGMVMKIAPLQRALDAARAWFASDALEPKVVYLSPQGRVLNQEAVQSFSGARSLILIAGRYEGIDERFIEAEVDEEWSIGDYVLSGGELPAMVLLDAVFRLLPGTLGDAMSAQQDSFCEGVLEHPHYTRPEVHDGARVPAVLLSGDHLEVAVWRRMQSLGRTYTRRPDLLEKLNLDQSDQALIKEYLARYKHD